MDRHAPREVPSLDLVKLGTRLILTPEYTDGLREISSEEILPELRIPANHPRIPRWTTAAPCSATRSRRPSGSSTAG